MPAASLYTAREERSLRTVGGVGEDTEGYRKSEGVAMESKK
jgi:hypothetical protein